MGACVSRKNSLVNYTCDEDPNIFIQKMMLLQEKISGILKQREEDNEAFERELMVFALKEAEWRKEKKKMKDETRRLRRTLEEKEERIRKMMMVSDKGESESSVSVSVNSVSVGGSSSGGASMMLAEHMREEKARRDETIEKWKMLYLSIKNELDDLIQRTHQGTLNWKEEDQEEEDNLVEGLQQELKAKDQTIEFLKAQITSMKNEENRRKREVDILRQSLKILSNKKGSLHQHLLSTPL